MEPTIESAKTESRTQQERGSVQEYQELGSNLRHYGNMQFAQLTVFVAMTGGLLLLVFRGQSSLSSCASTVVKWAGLVVAFLFQIMNQRAIAYWDRYFERAVEIEKSLGYRQYVKRPKPGFFTNTNAVRAVYILAFIFWLLALVWPSQF